MYFNIKGLKLDGGLGSRIKSTYNCTAEPSQKSVTYQVL